MFAHENWSKIKYLNKAHIYTPIEIDRQTDRYIDRYRKMEIDVKEIWRDRDR